MIVLVMCMLLYPALSCIIARGESPVAPRNVLQDQAGYFTLGRHPIACDRACAKLAAQLPSSLFPAKTGRFQFWDTKQSDLAPACRVEPSSSEEVSFVLKTLVNEKCHFAVKSGGHDRTPGSSNADGGVTIDLFRLNGVQIAKDRKSVKIGAGLRWIDVYGALEKEGLMVVGGRVADVGVGGLILGGGISFFSNRHGWACDNVLAYDIVLPDTSVQTVTQSSMQDLYRSLRGAGASNFGIITSFTLKAFSQPRAAGVWGGRKTFSWNKVPDLLELNYKFNTESMDLDPEAAIINLFGYRQSSDVWWGMNIYHHTTHTNTSTWPKLFQPYEKLEGFPESTHIDIKPLSNITLEIGQFSPPGDRNIYGTFTYHPSIALEQVLVDLFHEEANSVKDIAEFFPAAVQQPLSRNMIKNMRNRGGNTLGIAESGEQGPLIIFTVSWKWKLTSDDERSYAAYYRFMERAEAMAKDKGVWHPYKYINYAEATQDVWAGYGERRVAEMRQVQRMVDPDGVFAKGGLGGGYFKLNEMPGGETPGSEQ